MAMEARGFRSGWDGKDVPSPIIIHGRAQEKSFRGALFRACFYAVRRVRWLAARTPATPSTVVNHCVFFTLSKSLEQAGRDSRWRFLQRNSFESVHRGHVICLVSVG